MFRKASLLAALGAAVAFSAKAQTTYLQLGSEDYHLLDRLETRSGRLSDDLFLTVKPVARKAYVNFLLEKAIVLPPPVDPNSSLTEEDDAEAGQFDPPMHLSAIDRYNIQHARSVSGEWPLRPKGETAGFALPSKNPWFNTFYRTQPDFFSVYTKDFFLSVNPVITLQGLYEKDPVAPGEKVNYVSSRGIEIRGRIADKLGFYTYVADNQEQPPTFFRRYIEGRKAVPGADYYQTPSNRTYDYLMARGYIDFAAVKEHVNVTFGYDKHFLGDGYRSLFLSDFSAPGAFLRLNTRVWKLNYQNLYLELTPQYERGGDRRLPHKYATMHHLSINATKWLNIGVFESIIFDRRDRYEFSYLVPIIFYRQVERALGSPDNALLGLNVKAIAAKHLQFYGQFILDEFKFGELKAARGWWGNKFGVQAGAKYFDAFTVKNLDLQAEVNAVRPFTYSHNDTLANYTHYNQPLAHPLGAGFVELVGIAHYQPVRNLYLTLKGMYYRRGVDTGAYTQGYDIFRPNNERAGEYGYGFGTGAQAHCALLNFNASYELRENLFFDLGATHRRYSSDVAGQSLSTTYVYGGFRLNLARRDYDQF